MSKRDTAQYKIKDPADMFISRQPPIDRHPGVFLAETILPQWGLTNVSETARRLKVNRVGLINVLTGKSEISREFAYKLGALLRDEVADFLIAYQHAYNLAKEREQREAIKLDIERVAPAEMPAA